MVQFIGCFLLDPVFDLDVGSMSKVVIIEGLKVEAVLVRNHLVVTVLVLMIFAHV
jgi:hypothetical protein